MGREPDLNSLDSEYSHQQNRTDLLKNKQRTSSSLHPHFTVTIYTGTRTNFPAKKDLYFRMAMHLDGEQKSRLTRTKNRTYRNNRPDPHFVYTHGYKSQGGGLKPI